jgi:predicted permease
MGVPRMGNYKAEDLPALYRRLIERVEATPGVRSASFAVCGLVSGCVSNDDSVSVAGYDKKTGERILVQTNFVGARYFSTVGMHLVAGRDFEERDLASQHKVAVVNEAMANRYFPDHSAIGGLLGFPNPDTEIVGVIADARVNAVRQQANPMVYFPLPSAVIRRALTVRTAVDPARLTDELRNTLRRVDSNLVIEQIVTMPDQVKSTLNTDQLIASLTSTFGIIALGLACFGLYGVMSYAVARRNSELGVRMALGAARPEVLWIILKESLVLVCCGIALGFAMVYLLRGMLSAILFGIGAEDPSTLSLAAIILVIVGAVSAGVPAWRASRIDPLSALHYE